MSTDSEQLPEFEKPPVIEVVCGILFKELSSLYGVQLGSFWERLKPEYDHSKEVAPLAPAVEQFEEPQPLVLNLSEIPPLPRTWLMTKKEGSVYGLQRMPVTLYVEQWERLLDFADEIRSFAEEHKSELSRKK